MNGKTVARSIGYVLIVLLLIAAIGLAYKFTNGFNEDFKTFYLEYDGKQILTSESEMLLNSKEMPAFQVKYTFDGENAEPKDYKVKIIPNATHDFDYTVDGERYLYSKTGDMTNAFQLKKEQTAFSITVPKDYSLQGILQTLYGGKSVEIPNEAEENNPYPYTLVVSSYNEKVVYNIAFNILGANVKDITLTPSQIII